VRLFRIAKRRSGASPLAGTSYQGDGNADLVALIVQLSWPVTLPHPRSALDAMDPKTLQDAELARSAWIFMPSF
jgi:hypothetical protein